jgi:L-amino acid N-acyltransferase YncA
MAEHGDSFEGIKEIPTFMVYSNSMVTNIKIASDKDFDDIFRIWQDGQKYTTNQDPLRDEAYIRETLKAQLKQKDAHFFVAVSTDGEIIGWQSLIPLHHNPLMSNKIVESSTYVSEKHLNMNVGYDLLKFACGFARYIEAEFIFSWTLSTNKQLSRLAQKLNWQLIGELPIPNKNPLAASMLYYVYNVPNSEKY